jgi:two-component system, cell cycle sensor histidine kinase and response regulator CckA
MPSAGRNRHAPLTVLLVDDDPLFLEMGACSLEALGFQVLQARDGIAALAMVQGGAAEFGLVITDFRMPCLDGVETLMALRKLRPGVKAILCSGNTEADCLQGRVLEDGTFLGKPFHLDDLDAAIDRVLGTLPEGAGEMATGLGDLLREG